MPERRGGGRRPGREASWWKASTPELGCCQLVLSGWRRDAYFPRPTLYSAHHRPQGAAFRAE